jgi:hypothetical protein
MTAPTLPNLSEMSAQLANDNARVNNFLDGLTEEVDELVDAAMQENWDKVEKISNNMASSSDAHGYPKIATAARHLQTVLQHPEDMQEIKRSVYQLIKLYGRTRV